MRIIGLDVGEKRIGVASAGSDTRIAVPVGVVLADGSEWQELASIARRLGTNWFVLGLPRSNEGVETKQSLFVRKFAEELVAKIPGAKVRFQDESLTSVVAEERLKQRKKNYSRGDIDAEAACIILQDFLENFKIDEKVKNNVDNEEIIKKNEGKTNKHKKKLFLLIAIVVVIGLIAGAAWGVWQFREQQRREREEYFAYLESQMVAEVFNFTIRPGETITEVAANLSAVGFSETEVAEAMNFDYDFEFLKGRPEGASLEGYLYGETYEFYADATAKEVISRFLEGMGEVILENDLEARYAEKGLSLFEGVTLASVVQKEAPVGEMATVAQVFLSRLAYGWKLGSDVTVTYALDMVDPERKVFEYNADALGVDSCYNTRLYTGLPCGPIANPGLAALLAVAEPSETEYLYFLTGDDGLMYYSYTGAEHAANARTHCQELCNVSL